MNPKLSGLALAIPAALALGFPLGAAAHEGHAHALSVPGQTFEDGSRPIDLKGKEDSDVASQFGGKPDDRLPRNGGQGQQPIPEPETYAMMLAGLGILGAVVRRRRKANEEAPTG